MRELIVGAGVTVVLRVLYKVDIALIKEIGFDHYAIMILIRGAAMATVAGFGFALIRMAERLVQPLNHRSHGPAAEDSSAADDVAKLLKALGEAIGKVLRGK